VNRIVLVTGGSRSGKSRYALAQAETLPGRKVFVATCPELDSEMAARIRRHRAERPAHWQTVESREDLAGSLAGIAADAVVVDCLTLWVNNLLYAETARGLAVVTEETIAEKTREVMKTARTLAGHVYFVTNEVGMGIVPLDPLSRRYRDLAGRCNQVAAAQADEVVLMTCGLPMKIKS